MEVYPIKFRPILKEKIWGGNKLSEILNKETDLENVGESWEISGVEGNISEVINGPLAGFNLKEIIGIYQKDLVGSKVFSAYGEEFPLLIKFLDAQTNLSVQVHPDDEMASKYHNSLGKTEMWYIMDADEDAKIVLGLKDDAVDKTVLEQINACNVDSIFNNRYVKKGESYFVPAGEIHAIGAGILAAEIQQTSDVTYRVYDWDRVDDNGKKRELHTAKAIEATKVFPNKQSYPELTLNGTDETLVSCDFFTTSALYVSGFRVKDYAQLDSFVIYMCVEGEANVRVGEYEELVRTGETILIPAKAQKVEISSINCKFLEVYSGHSDFKALGKAS